jgi:hypothetical protein
MGESSEGCISNTLYPEVIHDKLFLSNAVIFRWIFSVLGQDAPQDLQEILTILVRKSVFLKCNNVPFDMWKITLTDGIF